MAQHGDLEADLDAQQTQEASQLQREPLLQESAEDTLPEVDLRSSSSPSVHQSEIPKRQPTLKTKFLRRIVITVASWTLGLILSLSHHILNSQLSGRPAKHQLWTTNAGSAFAFASKTALGVSLGSACSSLFWSSVRQQQGVPVRAIDGALSVLHQPMAFTNLPMIRALPALSATALISWIVPLSAIFTPGTLNVVTREVRAEMDCRVPVVNLTLFNTGAGSSPFSLYWSQFGGHYRSSANAMRQLGQRVLVGNMYLPPSSPCGSTCAYPISFDALGLSCSNPGDGGLAPNNPLRGAQDPWNGPLTFWSGTSGNFSVEGADDWLYVAWVGGSVNCTTVRATYNIEVQQRNGTATMSILNTEQHERVVAGIVPDLANSTALTMNNLAGIRDGAFSVLLGNITHTQTSSDGPAAGLGFNPPSIELIASSSFVATNDGIRNITFRDDLPQRLNDYIANVSLSLLSMREAVSEVGAKCDVLSATALYAYDRTSLLVAYGAALLLTAACLGMTWLLTSRAARFHDGELEKESEDFSSLLVATRNPSLDTVAEAIIAGRRGKEGADPLRLRFGRLHEGSEGSRFGLLRDFE